MSQMLSTNVLVIGKSGVGKSSLLNYIFGEKVEQTGTGKPVTKEGIYKHAYRLNENFQINIYDTWGLEANKAEQWKKLISEEVKNHDCQNIADWFHTILYCFSAKSARIEVFEKEIIKELIDSGNRVSVVLTHCDVNNVEEAIRRMKEELNLIGISENNITRVCSVSKKLIGGRSLSEPYGAEELIDNMKDNLWESICKKVPVILFQITTELMNSWERDCIRFIEDNVTVFNSSSEKLFEKINQSCTNMLERTMETMNRNYYDQVNSVIDYYNKLSEQLALICGNGILNTYVDKKLSVHYSRDTVEKIAENLSAFVIALINGRLLFLPSVLRDLRKDYLKKEIEKVKGDAISNCKGEIYRISSMLEEMR